MVKRFTFIISAFILISSTYAQHPFIKSHVDSPKIQKQNNVIEMDDFSGQFEGFCNNTGPFSLPILLQVRQIKDEIELFFDNYSETEIDRYALKSILTKNDISSESIQSLKNSIATWDGANKKLLLTDVSLKKSDNGVDVEYSTIKLSKNGNNIMMDVAIVSSIDFTKTLYEFQCDLEKKN